MKNTLSVIIPVYKAEDTLDRCIESVLQNAVDEIILVDDGSPDNCGKICDSWATRNTRIEVIHKKNGGQSDARNEGLKHVHGDFITFVDSDDEIASDTYSPLMEYISQHPETDILEYPARIHIGAKDEHLLYFNDNITEISSAKQKKTLWLNGLFSHSYVCNKIFRKELFENVSFCKGILFEDVLIIPELLNKAHFYSTCNRGLYRYYTNNNGTTRNFSNLPLLLHAQLKVCRDMDIDIRSKEADRLYLSLVNTQIDLYRNLGSAPILPYRRISLSSAQSLKEIIKISLYNILGLKALVKVLVLLRNFTIVMMPAYVFYRLTF